MDTHTQYQGPLDQEQEALWYFGGLRIIKALEEQIGGAGSIVEYAEPVGTRTSSYAPYQEDSAFYILEGEATFSSGKMTVRAIAGTFLFLPRNASFRSEATGPGPARMLTWVTPMGFAHRVTNMGNPGQALVLSPPTLRTREKLQQLAALLRNTARKPKARVPA